MRIKTNGIAQSIDQSFSETQLLPSYIGDNTARLYVTFTPDAAAGGTFADATTAEPVTAKTKDGYLICEYKPIGTYIDIEPLYVYFVRYLEQGTNKVLAGEKEVWDDFNKTITEKAKDIKGYRLCGSDEQTFVLDRDGKVITFYYEKLLLTTYTVKYLDVDDKKPLFPGKRFGDCEVGSMVSENAVAIDGYIALDPTEVSLELAESGNEIIFLYKKQPQLTSYTIHYIYKDENAEILPAKVIKNVPVGKEITENALPVEGFSPLNDNITFTLSESGNDSTLYYRIREDL